MLTTRERFQTVVTATEMVVLPILKAYDPKIQKLHFQYGHAIVIQEALKKMEGSPTAQYQRFPMVWIVEDFPERGIQPGLSVITPRIVVLHKTDKNYSREQRQELVFKPILWPIVAELLKQIDDSGVLEVNYQVPGTTIERPHFGVEGVYGNGGYIIDAVLDSIEIVNKELTIRRTECSA